MPYSTTPDQDFLSIVLLVLSFVSVCVCACVLFWRFLSGFLYFLLLVSWVLACWDNWTALLSYSSLLPSFVTVCIGLAFVRNVQKAADN